MRSGISQPMELETQCFSAIAAADNDSSIDKPAQNAAPAISNDGKTVYFVVNQTSSDFFNQSGLRSGLLTAPR